MKLPGTSLQHLESYEDDVVPAWLLRLWQLSGQPWVIAGVLSVGLLAAVVAGVR